MTDLQLTATIVGSGVGYLTIAGVTQEIKGWGWNEDGPLGLLWPFILPCSFGMWLVKMIKRPRVKLPKATINK